MKLKHLNAILGSLSSHAITPGSPFYSLGLNQNLSRIQDPQCAKYLLSYDKLTSLPISHYENIVYDCESGIFWNQDEPILELTTTFSRSSLKNNPRRPCSINLPLLDANIVVNSLVCSHYGHFLIESTGWLWQLFFPLSFDCYHVIACRSHVSLPKNMLSRDSMQSLMCYGIATKVNLARLFYGSYFVKEFFNLLASAYRPSLNLKYLSTSCVISDLYVPCSTYKFGCEPHALHRLAFAAIANHISSASAKGSLGIENTHMVERKVPKIIYLSRLKFSLPAKSARKIVNEEYLHQLLNSTGASVVYPELLSLRDQILLVNEATVLIGCESSALHTILFSSRESNLRRVIILRASQRSNKTFLGVDKLVTGLGIETSYIPALRVESQDGCFLNYADFRYCQSFDGVLLRCIEEALLAASKFSG